MIEISIILLKALVSLVTRYWFAGTFTSLSPASASDRDEPPPLFACLLLSIPSEDEINIVFPQKLLLRLDLRGK